MEDLGRLVHVLAVYVGEVARCLAVGADEDFVHPAVDLGVVGLDSHRAQDYLRSWSSIFPTNNQL